MTHRPDLWLLLVLLPVIGGCADRVDGVGSAAGVAPARAVAAVGVAPTPFATPSAPMTPVTLPMSASAASIVVAAAPAPPDAAGAAPAGNADALLASMRSEIGTAGCTSDAQCRTVGVGWKACGGPEAHLPWSTATASADRLSSLAADQQQARRRDVERSGMLSNCMLTPDPGAVCAPAADGQRACQLRRPTGGASVR